MLCVLIRFCILHSGGGGGGGGGFCRDIEMCLKYVWGLGGKDKFMFEHCSPCIQVLNVHI